MISRRLLPVAVRLATKARSDAPARGSARVLRANVSLLSSGASEVQLNRGCGAGDKFAERQVA